MRRLVILATIATMGLSLPGASAVAAEGRPGADATLRQYASATWASFGAMTDSRSGLPAESSAFVGAQLVRTAPPNTRAYSRSASLPAHLEIIARKVRGRRLSTTRTSP